MEGRFDNEHEEEDAVNSSFSGDEAEEFYIPSPKKSRKSTRKKVVMVPIGVGFRSKGDVHPPPDSWSWRKYGQKRIKGSPYPRGYYRCSSSKGCPAKRQVERSRYDPTTLLITYSSDHNHLALHTTTKNNHEPPAASAPPPNFSSEDCATEPTHSNSFAELGGEFGWLCEVIDSTMMDRTTLVTPTWALTDVEIDMPIGEEDKLLFGDLGDLPECALVFRHRIVRLEK